MARLALLIVPLVVAAGMPSARAAPDEHAQARKPKKKTAKKKKPAKKRRKSSRTKQSSRSKQPPVEPEEDDVLVIDTEDDVAAPPTSLDLGTAAITTPVPEPPYVADSVVPTTAPKRERKRGPTWFFGVRGGPALLDRRGYYNFRSNRQIYHDERNIRGEALLGRYLSRRISIAVAGGTGPYPKFDAPDPLYAENTRFSVFLYHSRVDLDVHAGPFVVGAGVGAAYEHTTGTFGVQDPVTLQVEMHRATFNRFAAIGAARTGLQVGVGPFAVELIAEATVLKLFRGTYTYSITTDGPSDREMGYAASLLLGVRLQ
jgi:hypothetical protein